jgi:hypothetical protein
MWDGKGFTERKRHLKEKIDIPRSTVNILAACTPSFLRDLLPEGAWDQGFMSRTVMAYSGEADPQDLWTVNGGQDELFKDLTTDLKAISKLYGPMDYEDEALDALRKWHLAGGPPRPDHPRLLTYNGRRTALLIKLCMVMSVASSDSMIITREHYERALALMLETEIHMPEIFKSMRSGGDRSVMDEVWHYIYQYNVKKNNRPMPHQEVFSFVSERTPTHNIFRLVDAMCRNGLLEEIKDVGGAGYKARKKREA